MANGDAAAAAGLDTLNPATSDLREGASEINKTRDYIAAHQTSGSHPAEAIVSGVFPIVRGGTGGSTAAAARTALGLDGSYVLQGGGSSMLGNTVRLGWSGSGLLAQVDATPLGKVVMEGTDVTFGRIYSPDGRANGISGGLTAYLGADGRLAVSASSRRFKKDIRTLGVNLQAVLAMRVVEFHWRADFLEPGQPNDYEQGLIAEELVDLGLEWLVFLDEDGLPRGVHYDKLALALIPLLQDHERRISALEARSGEGK